MRVGVVHGEGVESSLAASSRLADLLVDLGPLAEQYACELAGRLATSGRIDDATKLLVVVDELRSSLVNKQTQALPDQLDEYKSTLIVEGYAHGPLLSVKEEALRHKRY